MTDVQQEALVPVEQIDRNALAARYREICQPGMAEELEAGAMDDHPMLIILARHRRAGEAQARKDALAEAKNAVAAAALPKQLWSCSDDEGGTMLTLGRQRRHSIAAIEALEQRHEG